jgi:basic membrane lipoprotein Med (substrate-binding protein (PBP1-ABC) superfamily)
MDSYFSNSFSIGDGKPLVQALLQRGADAILPVAGPQTMDAVKEIQSYKSNCIVVGIDTEQELNNSVNGKSSYTDKTGDSNVIKFSAEKNISDITSQILSLSYAGFSNDSEIPGVDEIKVGSYGYLTVADIKNDGVASSPPSLTYLKEFIMSAYPDTPPPEPGEDLYQ